MKLNINNIFILIHTYISNMSSNGYAMVPYVQIKNTNKYIKNKNK